MVNNNDIDKIFKGINKIYFTAYRAYYMTHNLHFSEKEISEIIKNSIFLRFSQYTYYYMLVIELHKLFVKKGNNKCSFYKLLSHLDKIQHKSLFKFIENQLNSITQTTLTKLEKLRDNLYAHTDLDVDSIALNYTPNWDELELLINIGQNIINQINKDIYNKSFRIPPIEKVHVKRFLTNHNKFMKANNDYLIMILNNKNIQNNR